MKLSPKLVLLSIFTIFLISGLLTGRATARVGQIYLSSFAVSQAEGLSDLNNSGYPLPAVFNPDTIASQGDIDNSKQRSILIVTVDDLKDNRARLDSIWLILYVPNLPEITLIPVYPEISSTGDGLNIDLDNDLQAKFNLEPGAIIDPIFMTHLREFGITWSKYFILDRSTINQINQYATDLHKEFPPSSNREESSSIIPNVELTQTERILFQAEIAQNICHRYAEIMLTPDTVLRYFPRVLDRIETDLNAQEAAYEIWTIEEAMAGFSCVFPSFSAMQTAG